MRRASACLVLFLACVSLAGCGPTVDLTKGLQIDIANTGWFDLGIVNGQTKLVPTVTFTLKNVSDQRLVVLQVQALFRRANENDEWGNAFLPSVDAKGLEPGATTPPITLKSPLGYTGSDQTRQEMLANTHFVDARVDLLAKYGSTPWKKLGSYPITRQLLTK
jgi:hypothetical protein